MHMLNINNEITKSKTKLLLRRCVVFYSSFVCISAYANVYFKTILRECLRARIPPGFPSTTPPPVRVLAVLGTLGVWSPNQTKPKKKKLRTLTNEAERTLDLSTRRSRQGTSPWLSTEYLWVRSKRKRRGLV